MELLVSCFIVRYEDDEKNYAITKLHKIALHSRIVICLLDDLLRNTVYKKLPQYHLYCDNYFTSRDQFKHLQKIGLLKEEHTLSNMAKTVD